MDEKSKLLFDALSEAHDALLVRVAGLTAVLGAISEKYPVELSRVDAWCRAIAAHSDKQIGVGQTAVQRMAHDLLRGIGAKPKDQN
jgi:hypothetical protein